MLTGDRKEAAFKIGAQVGLTEADIHSQLLKLGGWYEKIRMPQHVLVCSFRSANVSLYSFLVMV